MNRAVLSTFQAPQGQHLTWRKRRSKSSIYRGDLEHYLGPSAEKADFAEEAFYDQKIAQTIAASPIDSAANRCNSTGQKPHLAASAKSYAFHTRKGPLGPSAGAQ